MGTGRRHAASNVVTVDRAVPQAAVDLIKEFEGLRLLAYDDRRPNVVLEAGDAVLGTLTIGYGHTKGVRIGQRITQQQAEALLKEDLAESMAAVAANVKVPLNDNQLSALLSFVHNFGERRLSQSSLLKKLNAGDYNAVPHELMRWVMWGSSPSAGLIRRRDAEAALWSRPS